jgi:hypothetical protein
LIGFYITGTLELRAKEQENMFILWGFGHRTIKNFGSLSSQMCENCHNKINKEILKVTTWFTLFFIPIIPYRVEYLVVCQICKSALKISKVDFEQIIESGASNLQSGSVIGRALNPDTSSGQTAAVHNKYAGKTETQIAYLKQMEEFEQRRLENR